ncbi:uncharacterized protein EHS24_008047 [Apiotrichum porosum]|uniref:Uncharacterized protein n=1 Tax=Apiotrichum porosum TaxID=105984 RepID=A0A427XSF1_9TREE|nr:uncharacterized protein EHS24_008047 [Apiotrichum porosum]RSH81852.1 hypothetical protein EHS24_008047 [Apiotrichum porosum]
MKFALIAITLASLVVAVPFTPEEIRAGAAARIGSRDAGVVEEGHTMRSLDDMSNADVMKRACSYNTPCNCSGLKAGLFCGDGVLGCTRGLVYQCSTDGHTTCVYGPRNSCKKCNALSC